MHYICGVIPFAAAAFQKTKILKMLYTLIFALLIMAVAVFIMSVKLIFKKGGKFPNGHIGHSKAMKSRGIKCAVSTDAGERRQKDLKERITTNNNK